VRTTSIFVALVLVAGTSIAAAQTVIVPETTYSGLPTSLTRESTALIDRDSVLIAYTVHNAALLMTVHFQVVNIDTGAIELPPVPLPDKTTGAMVAVLAPDSGLITVRDDNDGSRGKYFVVNLMTGSIVRGPVPFTSSGLGGGVGVAVIDPTTVLIAYQGFDTGVFSVVDPQTGTVKVPETRFAPAWASTLDAVTLDAHRVVIAYGSEGPDSRMSFTVVDPQDGHIVRPPTDIGAGLPLETIARNLDEIVIVYYDTAVNAGKFLTLDTTSGTRSPAVTFATGGMSDPAAALIGTDALFIGFERSALTSINPGEYVVYALDGPQLIPATPFNNPGSTFFVSATSSDCRTFISYQDGADEQKGKFQVLDFADVCIPPPCPPDLTEQLDFYPSAFVPFFVPELRLQLVLVQSRSTEPIQGPFAFIAADLRNASLLGSQETGRCGLGGPARFVRLSAGPDDVLSPGELGGAFLLFHRTSLDPITYRRRILNGIPPR
jgi:hypothetical protein